MDLSGFSAEMTKRGCVSDGKSFCGTFQNFPFATTFMRGSANGATSFSLRFLFGQKVTAKMFKEVAKNLKGTVKIQRQNSLVNMLFFTTTVSKNQAFDSTFDSIISTVTAMAVHNGLTAPNVCPLCSKPGCDSYAYHGIAYQPVHAACVQQQSQKAQEAVQKNEQKGNYATGIVGAILGGIVGALPAVLLMGLFESVYAIIYALACAVIPLGAFYGYKLFRGKMNRAAMVVVVLDSILMALVANYMTAAFIFYKEFQYVLTPAMYYWVFMDYFNDMIWELIQNLFFVGLGLLYVWSIIGRTNTHVWKEATFALSTLRPIDPNAPVAAAAPAPAMPAPDMPAAAVVQPVAATTLPPEMADSGPALQAEPPAGPDMD